MGFGRMSMRFARMFCGGSGVALCVLFGSRLVGFRGILVVRSRFVVSFLWHSFLRLAL